VTLHVSKPVYYDVIDTVILCVLLQRVYSWQVQFS